MPAPELLGQHNRPTPNRRSVRLAHRDLAGTRQRGTPRPPARRTFWTAIPSPSLDSGDLGGGRRTVNLLAHRASPA